MNGIKEIIVVSPEQYKDLARRISHEISKVQGCNGAFWTIKQFEDNEFQLGGNRYAILIGNSNENPITTDFLPVINNLQNRAGACYGFDGTKAVVFGEGRLDQMKDLIALLEKTSAIIKKGSAYSTVGASIAATSIVFMPFSAPLILATMFGSFLNIEKKQQQLRTEQTKQALTLFLSDHFDKWIGLEK